MSDAELNALERDVEQAERRFADDLARLRSPSTLARFKDDVWAEARETKDELVGKTKEAAKDGAERLFTELKERAAANPVAALAIGAGLAWRLVHRPPVATLLVGMGLVGLLRTSPARNAGALYGPARRRPPLAPRDGAGGRGWRRVPASWPMSSRTRFRIGAPKPGMPHVQRQRKLPKRRPPWRSELRGLCATHAMSRATLPGMSETAPRPWLNARPMACMTRKIRPASPPPV